MKQKIRKFAGIAVLVLLFQHSFSQATSSGPGLLGHTGTALATDWCGWNAASNIPFSLEHRGNQQMTFSTNGFMRMFIDGGNGLGNPGLGGGRIAIGNNLPAGFIPQSRVHIHQAGGNPAPGNNTYIRFTNNVTGVLATDGFAIGNTSALFNSGTVQMQQYEQAPVSIFLPNGGGVLTNYFHILNGTGFTGINTNAPTRQFDVNGKVRVQNLTSIGANAGIVTNFADGTLQNILFTGNPAQVLLGNGTFGTVPGGGGGASFCAPLPNNNVVKATAIANQVCGTNIYDLPTNFVGINTTAPNDAFEVGTALGGNGNIDIANGNSAYKIANSEFLWNKGVSTNVLVGVGAGAGLPVGTTNRNIFIGGTAGFNANILANRVTNIGFESGYNDNSAVSSFYGWRSGYSNTDGDFNTFIGGEAGELNTLGGANAYLGGRAGQNNNGSNNCIFGFNSALTILNGNNNVIIGSSANTTAPNLINGIVIGANAIVTNNNQMILGNNSVNVGIGLSGNVAGPQNKLEINRTSAINPLSGLRLTDLAGATPVATTSSVLTVNANGDVVIANVVGSGGVALGNLCTVAQNPILGNYEIPLNNNNFYISADNINTNKVNIGLPCGAIQPGKLNVTTAFQSNPTLNESYGIYSTTTYNNPTSTNTGIYGSSVCNTINTRAIGLHGYATGFRDAKGVFGVAGPVTAGPATAGWFESTDNTNITNFGIVSRAYNGTGSNYGIEAQSFGTTVNYGGVFTARNGSNVNIGVTGIAFPTPFTTNPSTFPLTVNIGIYGQSGTNVGTDYAGFFDGDVFINGPTNGTNYALTSDQMFKTNVDTITNALNIIKQLKPKSFYFDTTNIYGMRFNSKKQYGLLAQDVQTVLPELVSQHTKPAMLDSAGAVITHSISYKGLNYDAFTSIMIRAIQQLSAQNHKLDSIINLQSTQIAALTSSINSCCSNTSIRTTGVSGNNINQLTISLSDADVIVLNQNVPNPFAEQTTITYNVPAQYGFAQMIFKTLDGKIIRTVDITIKGKGQLNVYANDLSNGLYMYSLIVDGKVIDSKKMVKQ